MGMRGRLEGVARQSWPACGRISWLGVAGSQLRRVLRRRREAGDGPARGEVSSGRGSPCTHEREILLREAAAGGANTAVAAEP
jgi:hypothetical protein